MKNWVQLSKQFNVLEICRRRARVRDWYSCIRSESAVFDICLRTFEHCFQRRDDNKPSSANLTGGQCTAVNQFIQSSFSDTRDSTRVSHGACKSFCDGYFCAHEREMHVTGCSPGRLSGKLFNPHIPNSYSVIDRHRSL